MGGTGGVLASSAVPASAAVGTGGAPPPSSSGEAEAEAVVLAGAATAAGLAAGEASDLCVGMRCGQNDFMVKTWGEEVSMLQISHT